MPGEDSGQRETFDRELGVGRNDGRGLEVALLVHPQYVSFRWAEQRHIGLDQRVPIACDDLTRISSTVIFFAQPVSAVSSIARSSKMRVGCFINVAPSAGVVLRSIVTQGRAGSLYRRANTTATPSA